MLQSFSTQIIDGFTDGDRGLCQFIDFLNRRAAGVAGSLIPRLESWRILAGEC